MSPSGGRYRVRLEEGLGDRKSRGVDVSGYQGPNTAFVPIWGSAPAPLHIRTGSMRALTPDTGSFTPRRGPLACTRVLQRPRSYLGLDLLSHRRISAHVDVAGRVAKEFPQAGMLPGDQVLNVHLSTGTERGRREGDVHKQNNECSVASITPCEEGLRRAVSWMLKQRENRGRAEGKAGDSEEELRVNVHPPKNTDGHSSKRPGRPTLGPSRDLAT